MKQFIFDILKMYIEFLLYNYQEVKGGWFILAIVFMIIMIGFGIHSENENTSNFAAVCVCILFLLIIFAEFFSSQEAFQYVLTMLKT